MARDTECESREVAQGILGLLGLLCNTPVECSLADIPVMSTMASCLFVSLNLGTWWVDSLVS